MPVRVRTVALVAAALVAMTLGACTTSHHASGGTTGSSATGPAGAGSSADSGRRPGPVARTPISSSTTTAHPDYRAQLMARPLHLPKLRPGQACPTSGGTPINTRDFGGVAQGDGPVHPLGPDTRGVAELISHTNHPPGWLAFKSIWFSEPRYRGPFLIRIRRIDHPGPVGLRESPGLTSFFVPSGDTDVVIDSGDGYRGVPGATWVKAPGCIAWQVDGLGFSHVIVVRVVCRPPECVTPRHPDRTSLSGLRAATGYADYGARISGRVPDKLWRPLHLPTLDGGRCPVSKGRSVTKDFGEVWGDGPIYAGPVTVHDPIRFDYPPPRGSGFESSAWSGFKVLWIGAPEYDGPVLIRGRQVDGSPLLGFAGTPSNIRVPYAALEFPPGVGTSEPLSDHGWRNWPSMIRVRSSGCYAVQIDGLSFSDVVVFRAVAIHQ